jgi:hypothetical protein
MLGPFGHRLLWLFHRREHHVEHGAWAHQRVHDPWDTISNEADFIFVDGDQVSFRALTFRPQPKA